MYRAGRFRELVTIKWYRYEAEDDGSRTKTLLYTWENIKAEVKTITSTLETANDEMYFLDTVNFTLRDTLTTAPFKPVYPGRRISWTNREGIFEITYDDELYDIISVEHDKNNRVYVFKCNRILQG